MNRQIFLLAIILTLAACGNTKATPVAISDPVFPDYVRSSEMALKTYQLAVRDADMLYHLPCYCGCAVSLKHESLHDCFFKQDGSFEEHASGCGVCQLEVIDAAQWQSEGKSLKLIRQMIDTKYSSYGTGTDTPRVP